MALGNSIHNMIDTMRTRRAPHKDTVIPAEPCHRQDMDAVYRYTYRCKVLRRHPSRAPGHRHVK